MSEREAGDAARVASPHALKYNGNRLRYSPISSKEIPNHSIVIVHTEQW